VRRWYALRLLTILIPLLGVVACESCSAIAGPSGIVVQLTDFESAHPAGVSVHACYGTACADTTTGGSEQSPTGPQPSEPDQTQLTIALPPIAAPAETLRVQATDVASGQRILDTSLNVDVPVQKAGAGQCAVPYRRATVQVTAAGRLERVS